STTTIAVLIKRIPALLGRGYTTSANSRSALRKYMAPSVNNATLMPQEAAIRPQSNEGSAEMLARNPSTIPVIGFRATSDRYRCGTKLVGYMIGVTNSHSCTANGTTYLTSR